MLQRYRLNTYNRPNLTVLSMHSNCDFLNGDQIQKKEKSLDGLYIENWSDIYFTGFKMTITNFFTFIFRRISTWSLRNTIIFYICTVGRQHAYDSGIKVIFTLNSEAGFDLGQMLFEMVWFTVSINNQELHTLLPVGLSTPRNPAWPRVLNTLCAGNCPSSSHLSTKGLISLSMI